MNLIRRLLRLFRPKRPAKKHYHARPRWYPCECGAVATAGFVRVFEYTDDEPLAPDVGGLPAQAWMWQCNFEIVRKLYGVPNPEEDVIMIEGAKEAPPIAAVFPLLRLGIEQKCRWLLWERLDGEGRDATVRVKRFDLKRFSL